MTRSEALRQLVTAPRDHVDQGRIGKRVIHEKADDAKVRIPRRTKVQRLVDAYNQKHGMKVSA